MDKGYYKIGLISLPTYALMRSQSTIKMDKGYYTQSAWYCQTMLPSQSTIKMDKGYYRNGGRRACRRRGWSQSTIKMDKGYYKSRLVMPTQHNR